jgi:capsular polysaccharide transport system permease protein
MASTVEFRRPFPRPSGDRDLPPLPALLTRVARRRRILVHLFWIALPLVAALLYLTLNAATRYDVESDFTVQPLLQSAGANLPAARNAAHLMNLAQNAAPGAYEAYMVVDYLQSPDALKTLEQKIGFFDRYRGKTADLFYRPEPWRLVIWHWLTGKPYAVPFEDRLAFYNLMVMPRYSMTENIVTLEVQAFGAADAHLIAATLLTMGEDFINRANERVLTDLVRSADGQVRTDQRRLDDDHVKVKAWRAGNSDLDPDQLTQMVTQVVQGLETDLVTARSAQMRDGDSGNAAARAAAALRVKAIETQIAREQRQLADMERSYAAKFYEYDRLREDIQFAKSAYQNDLVTLQSFRDLAAQQEVYLLRIFAPWVPDEALYPDWLAILPLTLLGGAMAYGLIRMVMALGRDKWGR